MKTDINMQNEYKIMRHSYFDEYGKEKNICYYILERRRFLGIPFWKEITHKVYGMGDCFNTTTQFKTIEDAEKFIKKTLCSGKPHDKLVEKEVKKVSC